MKSKILSRNMLSMSNDCESQHNVGSMIYYVQLDEGGKKATNPLATPFSPQSSITPAESTKKKRGPYIHFQIEKGSQTFKPFIPLIFLFFFRFKVLDSVEQQQMQSK